MATKRSTGEGGPRRKAEIFAATLDLLAGHGYDGLTIEGVAQASGVNKTTIYRWWPSKSELLRDALLHSRTLHFEIADTGNLRGDLADLAARVQALLTEDRSRTVVEAALVGAVRHEAMREMVISFLDDRFGRHQPIFERAVRRGELPAEFDPAPLVDAMAGALWIRALVRRGPMAGDFAGHLVSLLMEGVDQAARRSAPPAR
ncbi:TetR/AcrR family transcriptional regulator [Streptomyces sp. NPDC049577]|uniref:TetR/AcrR family transcriptional regulator n=1 Tax=Streptomyces sp. NPDC049577 TaxID=3155153 RepID=UPI00341BD4CA